MRPPVTITVNGNTGTPVLPPIIVDNEPFYGSLLDSTPVNFKMPMSSADGD